MAQIRFIHCYRCLPKHRCAVLTLDVCDFCHVAPRREYECQACAHCARAPESSAIDVGFPYPARLGGRRLLVRAMPEHTAGPDWIVSPEPHTDHWEKLEGYKVNYLCIPKLVTLVGAILNEAHG